MTQLLLSETLPSPVGAITILTDGDGVLHALEFEDHHDRMERLLRLHCPQGWRIKPAVGESDAWRALTAYFAGDLSAIDTLPTATGGTAFQRAVWAALRDVPAGRTVAYADIAAAIDRPSAMRAVGMANGSNPIAIVVPCHRIIGRSGQLTGYAGGLARKQWLLAHEGVATGLLV
ncbi:MULTISPECIES: methylated-DNA--[protein]-cysteine S-methyltransferase [unclassified Sphingomonas]|uniref:methylated-DNA--[protein]-cysteine S-methyltransferase n=1 Tax=unclassified Sphingomonas TaxID=196159 RepID=UPI000701EC08|nr:MULTISPECIES: methylated-DNA--[protein]-cysteine S-methyltransferase [unclassified Sphingomonas]KQM24900.1 cysteine methyltransferase [Sphingomonas sp. Leaf9]KQM42558.1 cysteine methyltransferase [Sphingomonas sp. Leaf11]